MLSWPERPRHGLKRPRRWQKDYQMLSVLLGAVMWMALPVRAEVVPDLYAVTVPVAEQSQAELQRAAAAGMRELAVRVSGRSSAASDPALAALFANAVRYLDQYRYERSNGADAAWLAQLHFAAAQVDGELRRAGLPVWGGNRPALQTLIALDNNGTRTIIDENSPVANTLREQWRRRGLVLHLPRNASAIDSNAVMKLDIAAATATAQERTDGYVLARIALASTGACDSAWTLQLANQMFKTEAAGSALPSCVASALDRIVDNMSAQYAIAANSGAEGIVLRVTGVVSYDDYSALLNYLRRLAAVKNAQPLLIHGDEILLQLKVAGNTEQLARQLALESRLTQSDTANASNASIPVALSYRWAALQGTRVSN